MRSDAVATVLLAEWALTTNYFDGAAISIGAACIVVKL
jgi:hypothetical protein